MSSLQNLEPLDSAWSDVGTCRPRDHDTAGSKSNDPGRKCSYLFTEVLLAPHVSEPHPQASGGPARTGVGSGAVVVVLTRQRPQAKQNGTSNGTSNNRFALHICMVARTRWFLIICCSFFLVLLRTKEIESFNFNHSKEDCSHEEHND
jgi:hypothetical protein